MDLVEGGTLEE